MRLIIPLLSLAIFTPPAWMLLATEPLSDAACETTSDQEWAEALWIGLPGQDDPEDLCRKKFAAALIKADRKAPIYVSFGDYESGIGTAKTMSSLLTADFESKAQKIAEAEIAGKVLDLENPKTVQKLLKEIVRNTYEKLVHREFHPRLNESIRQKFELLDVAEAYFIAATIEDPDYLPAWFQLAKNSEGLQAREFAEEFSKRDPENALADYLLAVASVREKNLGDALLAIERGNTKPSCRWYPSEFPMEFKLTYPDSGFSREYEIVGRPIPKSALIFFVRTASELADFADPFLQCLMLLNQELLAEAERLLNDGKTPEARKILEVMRLAGQRLIRHDPLNSTLVLRGVMISRGAIECMQRHNLDHQDTAQRQRLDEEWKIFAQIPVFMSKQLNDLKPGPALFKQISLGEIDYSEQSRSQLEKILQDSGFHLNPTSAP